MKGYQLVCGFVLLKNSSTASRRGMRSNVCMGRPVLDLLQQKCNPICRKKLDDGRSHMLPCVCPHTVNHMFPTFFLFSSPPRIPPPRFFSIPASSTYILYLEPRSVLGPRFDQQPGSEEVYGAVSFRWEPRTRAICNMVLPQ